MSGPFDVGRLSPDARERLIRSAWYAHDARWFNAVAADFGMETANRLNRHAVRDLGRAEARRLAGALGRAGAADLPEFLDFLKAAQSLLVPADLIELDVHAAGSSSYEVEVRRCFVAENVARAGIADRYECADFDRLSAWHAALGLPLVNDLPAATCAFARGQPCRRTLSIAGG